MINNSSNNISIQRNQHITIDSGAHISPAVLGRVQIPNIATMISPAPLPSPSQQQQQPGATVPAPTTVVTTTTTVAQPVATGGGGNGSGPPQTIPLNEKFNTYEREKRARLAMKFEQFSSYSSSGSRSDCSGEAEGEEEEEEEDEGSSGDSERGCIVNNNNNNSTNATTTSSSLADLMEEEADGDESAVPRKPPKKKCRTPVSPHRHKRKRKAVSSSSASSRSHSYSSDSASSSCSTDSDSSAHNTHRHRGHHRYRNRPSFNATSRYKRPRRRYISIQDDCFLCAWGNKFHDGIRVPHIQALYLMIDKFYGRMTNDDLANMVHLYYKRKIYRHGCGMQMLMPYVVVQHLEGNHSLSAVNFLVESVKDYMHIRAIAKDSIYQADGTIDYKAFGMHEKAQTKIEKLYLMKIQNMNFNDGVTTEDINSKGVYANLMPMFSQKEPVTTSRRNPSSRRAILPPPPSSKKQRHGDKQSQLVLPRKSANKGDSRKPTHTTSLTEFEM